MGGGDRHIHSLGHNVVSGHGACLSASGAKVNFSSGTKDVFCDYPAGRAVIGGMGYIENEAVITQSSTVNDGHNAISGGPVTIASGVTVTVPSGSNWTVV